MAQPLKLGSTTDRFQRLAVIDQDRARVLPGRFLPVTTAGCFWRKETRAPSLKSSFVWFTEYLSHSRAQKQLGSTAVGKEIKPSLLPVSSY